MSTLDEAIDQICALVAEHGGQVPSAKALAELRQRLVDLRGNEKWKRCADMTRQTIDRYLSRVELPAELAPIVASIMAQDGEPWAAVVLNLGGIDIFGELGVGDEGQTRKEGKA